MVMENYGPKSNVPVAPGLISETTQINSRLMDMVSRLSKIADSLHGPVPREAGNTAGESKPPASNNLRRNIDSSFVLLSQCDNEIERIESRL